MIEYPKIETLFNRGEDFKVKLYETRLPEFENVKNWLLTEKIDGTNIRIHLTPDGKRLVGGRTDNAQIPAPLLATLDELFPVEKLREVFPEGNVTLFGEGYGPKIQKGGGNYRQDPGFILFDVHIAGWWLEWLSVEDVAAKLGIDVVPVLGCANLAEAVDVARSFQQSTFGDFKPEGIVARACPMLLTRSGKRLVWKLKHTDF